MHEREDHRDDGYRRYQPSPPDRSADAQASPSGNGPGHDLDNHVRADDRHEAQGEQADEVSLEKRVRVDHSGSDRRGDPAGQDHHYRNGDSDGEPIVDLGTYELYPCTEPSIRLFEDEFIFKCELDNPQIMEQVLEIRNQGAGLLQWWITEDCQWLEVIPSAGSSSGEINEVVIRVDSWGLDIGVYDCQLQVSADDAVNSPQFVDVALHIVDYLHVPAEYSTIQAAINDAVDGDMVVVDAGTYIENINFGGKNIVLTSTNPDNWSVVEDTTVKGTGSGCVVTFTGTEGPGCILTGFTITGGYDTEFGGAGVQGNHTHATLTNCIVTGNETTVEAGGGIRHFDGTISHCKIIANKADSGKGGGIAGSNGRISNCLFVGNSVLYGGSAINNCDGDIINCTITANAGPTEGAVRDCDGKITNCIVWGNDSIAFYSCSAEITYNCFPGAFGEGNIEANPLFVDTSSSDPNLCDYHLRWNSPCIDAARAPCSTVDIDGEPRFMNGRVDMGIDEVGPKQADFTRDGRIDIADFEVFSRSWNTQPTNENWYILSDLWEDELIDINDLAALVADWIWVSEWH